jgi:hypothetical protein
MGRIKMVPPPVPKGDGRTVKPEPKQADPFSIRQATRRTAANGIATGQAWWDRDRGERGADPG